MMYLKSIFILSKTRLGYETWSDHCDVFLDKSLYSPHASLHAGVWMGTLQILRETRQDIIGEGGRGLRWLENPPGGEWKYLSSIYAIETEIIFAWMSHLALVQT